MKIVSLKDQIKVIVPFALEFDKSFRRTIELMNKYLKIKNVNEASINGALGYFVSIDSSVNDIDKDSEVLKLELERLYQNELKIDQYFKSKELLCREGFSLCENFRNTLIKKGLPTDVFKNTVVCTNCLNLIIN